MRIVESSKFSKKVSRLTFELQRAYKERLLLFASNPYHPLLNNHKLTGDRKEQRSINITGDWRVIFEEYEENTVRLIDIDTHHNLYGK